MMEIERESNKTAIVTTNQSKYRLIDDGLSLIIYEHDMSAVKNFVFVGATSFDNRSFDNDSDIVECFERWLAVQKQAIEDTHENFSCRYPYYCPFVCCSERH